MESPIKHMSAISREYPDLWHSIENLRHEFKKQWPAWCFLPMSAMGSYLSARNGKQSLNMTLAEQVEPLTALATWRYTQGIPPSPLPLFTRLAKSNRSKRV